MVGKISYDVAKDEFSMNEPLAMIGGGIKDVIEFMEQRYMFMADVAYSLFWMGVAILSLSAFSMYTRYRVRKNRERIE